MPLTILRDDDVRKILLSLTKEDVIQWQDNLAEALHEYSTGTQDQGCCSSNQPMRTVLSSSTNTTLFMPARTSTSTGCKIVSLAASAALAADNKPSTSSAASTASTASGSTSTPTPSISTNPSSSSSQTTTPKGSLTLMAPNGQPIAFINAEELTAFRTALAATYLISKRTKCHSIVVFGAGKQAYWHIRLALLLRGHDIHHVRIINRTFAGAEPLMKQIYTSPEWKLLRESNPKLDFSLLSRDYREYTRLLKDHVRDADAIFCCTPSTEPLFPGEYLTSHEGRKKGRLLSLIGSYKPHMLEVDPSILQQAVHSGQDAKHHHHRHADTGGVIVVDGIEACMKEAGEIIQAGITAAQLVEIGELIMVKKAVMKEIALGGEGEKGLKKWLMEGNVVYKSVGLGLMDVTVAEDLLQFAVEKGVGITVDNF